MRPNIICVNRIINIAMWRNPWGAYCIYWTPVRFAQKRASKQVLQQLRLESETHCIATTQLGQ